MNLKKGKHFIPKKENNFLMSCFSFQTRKGLVLVKFWYNAAVRRFLKTFRKYTGKRLWWKLFLGKLKLFKMDSGKGFFISFLNTFLWLLPNIEQRRTPLNDNIVWCKYSIVIKDLSKSWFLFLLNAPKYLGARLFYSLFAQTYTYFLKFIPPPKKSVKLKRFHCKDNSSLV